MLKHRNKANIADTKNMEFFFIVFSLIFQILIFESFSN